MLKIWLFVSLNSILQYRRFSSKPKRHFPSVAHWPFLHVLNFGFFVFSFSSQLPRLQLCITMIFSDSLPFCKAETSGKKACSWLFFFPPSSDATKKRLVNAGGHLMLLETNKISDGLWNIHSNFVLHLENELWPCGKKEKKYLKGYFCFSVGGEIMLIEAGFFPLELHADCICK